MKQQTWEDGQWLKGLGLSGSQAGYILQRMSHELQRQRQEIIELIKNERTAAITPPADEWINKWRLLNKLEGK